MPRRLFLFCSATRCGYLLPILSYQEALTLFFDLSFDVSQVIAKGVILIGCSLLKVTGEVQLRAQRVSSLDCLRLLPFP
jgi:hypothetical protein